MGTNYAKIVKGMTKMMDDLQAYADKKQAEIETLDAKVVAAVSEEGKALATLDKLAGIFG